MDFSERRARLLQLKQWLSTLATIRITSGALKNYLDLMVNN